MIHPPWMMTIGNEEDHLKGAEILKAITAPIVNVYKAQVKDKINEEKIRQLMEDETWMTADEASSTASSTTCAARSRPSRRSTNRKFCAAVA